MRSRSPPLRGGVRGGLCIRHLTHQFVDSDGKSENNGTIPLCCVYSIGTQVVEGMQKHTLPPMMVLCKVLKTYLNAAKTLSFMHFVRCCKAWKLHPIHSDVLSFGIGRKGCSKPWSVLLHAMERFAPSHGAFCSKPWSNLLQGMERDAPPYGAGSSM